MADEYVDPQLADPHWPPKRYHHCIRCYAKHRTKVGQMCPSCLRAETAFEKWKHRLVAYMPARFEKIVQDRRAYIHAYIYTPNRKAFETLQRRGGKKKSPKWIKTGGFLPPVPKKPNGKPGEPEWAERCRELYVLDDRGASVVEYIYL
jgi:hypothetical protein